MRKKTELKIHRRIQEILIKLTDVTGFNHDRKSNLAFEEACDELFDLVSGLLEDKRLKK
jgi:hypothetical protein